MFESLESISSDGSESCGAIIAHLIPPPREDFWAPRRHEREHPEKQKALRIDAAWINAQKHQLPAG
jgi:hypothetical protein